MARGTQSGPRGRGFHEAPLVLFTFLATMGGGVGAAHVLGALVGANGLALSRSMAILLTALFAGALLASLGHLGRPLRGPFALRRVIGSALSHEVLAVGATLAGGSVAALLPSESSAATWVGGFTSLAAMGTLITMGLVYRLPHQLAWGGPAVLQPLAQGALWGWVALHWAPWLSGSAPTQHVLLPSTTFWVLLAADTIPFMLRLMKLWVGPGTFEVPHPRLFRVRRWLLGIRLALGGLVPASLLLVGAGSWALLSLTVAVALDRLAFYGLALRRSTEGEVAAVEALL